MNTVGTRNAWNLKREFICSQPLIAVGSKPTHENLFFYKAMNTRPQE
jgi:hypothetical protein